MAKCLIDRALSSYSTGVRNMTLGLSWRSAPRDGLGVRAPAVEVTPRVPLCSCRARRPATSLFLLPCFGARGTARRPAGAARRRADRRGRFLSALPSGSPSSLEAGGDGPDSFASSTTDLTSRQRGARASAPRAPATRRNCSSARIPRGNWCRVVRRMPKPWRARTAGRRRHRSALGARWLA